MILHILQNIQHKKIFFCQTSVMAFLRSWLIVDVTLNLIRTDESRDNIELLRRRGTSRNSSIVEIHDDW